MVSRLRRKPTHLLAARSKPRRPQRGQAQGWDLSPRARAAWPSEVATHSGRGGAGTAGAARPCPRVATSSLRCLM